MVNDLSSVWIVCMISFTYIYYVGIHECSKRDSEKADTYRPTGDSQLDRIRNWLHVVFKRNDVLILKFACFLLLVEAVLWVVIPVAKGTR